MHNNKWVVRRWKGIIIIIKSINSQIESNVTVSFIPTSISAHTTIKVLHISFIVKLKSCLWNPIVTLSRKVLDTPLAF